MQNLIISAQFLYNDICSYYVIFEKLLLNHGCIDFKNWAYLDKWWILKETSHKIIIQIST